MYYSVTGEPFSVSDKDKPEAFAITYVQLNIYTMKKNEMEAGIGLADGDSGIKTELSIAHDIPAEQFFTSETWCMLVNEEGEVLSVDTQNIFSITLYRNINKPQLLKIKFTRPDLPGVPEWKTQSAHRVWQTFNKNANGEDATQKAYNDALSEGHKLRPQEMDLHEKAGENYAGEPQ